MPAEEWRLRAKCRRPEGISSAEWTAQFFPEGYGSKVGDVAKAFCEGCPVTAECLEVGLHERFGTWGKTTESERRRIRQRRASQVA